MLGGLDQRQAETFAFGRRQQGRGIFVQLDQHLVRDAGQPEQAPGLFGMGGHAFAHLLDHPALLADHHQVDVDPALPQQLEGGQRLGMALARLDRADHQEAGALAERGQHLVGIRRQAEARGAGVDVGAQVEVGQLERAAARHFLAFYPPGQFVGHCARDAQHAVGHLVDGAQEVAEILFGPEREYLGPQDRQHVVDDEIDLHAARAHLEQALLVLRGAVGEQVEAEEHVAGTDLARRVFQRQLGFAHLLHAEAARIAIRLIRADRVHRLDPEARRRRGEQRQQDAAHHALDAGLEVGLHHGRDVDQQLALRRRRAVERDRGGQRRQLGLGRQRRRGVHHAAVDGVAAIAREVLDRLEVQAADLWRRVMARHVFQRVAGQAFAQRAVGAQAGQAGRQVGGLEAVLELDQDVVRQQRGRAVGVDHGRHAVQQAVEHRGRGLAAGGAAQLHRAVGGGQPVGVGRGVDEAGDADAAGRGAGGDLFRQLLAIGAGIVGADEHQPAVRIGAQRRRQEGVQQLGIELGAAQHAEGADHEGVVVQAEAAARGGARRGAPGVAGGAVRTAAQQRDGAPAVGGAGAIPFLGQGAREIGMHDHAVGVVEHRLVERVGPDRRIAAFLAVRQQAGIAVRFVQRAQEALRQVFFAFQVVEYAREIEVVQHHSAGHVAQQLEHVLVGVRIAEVVDHALELVGVGAQPVGVAQAHAVQTAVVDLVLGHHQLDVVERRQLGHQFGAVVGNAGVDRRQRRDVGKLRAGRRQRGRGEAGGGCGQQRVEQRVRSVGIGRVTKQHRSRPRLASAGLLAKGQHRGRRQAGDRMTAQQRADLRAGREIEGAHTPCQRRLETQDFERIHVVQGRSDPQLAPPLRLARQRGAQFQGRLGDAVGISEKIDNDAHGSGACM